MKRKFPVGIRRDFLLGVTLFHGNDVFSNAKVLQTMKPQSLSALDLVRLTPLMERSSGMENVIIALIDGPVVATHPALSNARIRDLGARGCSFAGSVACQHGTFVAGILAARRNSGAASIAPDCALLVRPIFAETVADELVSAHPEELADAISECVDAGAHVVNLSVALLHSSAAGEARIKESLRHAVHRGVLVVTASGNQASVGSTAITRYPWVIPVVACDSAGRPLGMANLGRSIGNNGLCAPGRSITSLGTDGKLATFTGSSAAVPFVTGTIALLRSLFPNIAADTIKRALLGTPRGRTLVPPVLNAWKAFEILNQGSSS